MTTVFIRPYVEKCVIVNISFIKFHPPHRPVSLVGHLWFRLMEESPGGTGVGDVKYCISWSRTEDFEEGEDLE